MIGGDREEEAGEGTAERGGATTEARQNCRAGGGLRAAERFCSGSWARGNHQAMSDVDLVIPEETETPFLDRPAIPMASPVAYLRTRSAAVNSERRWGSRAG